MNRDTYKYLISRLCYTYNIDDEIISEFLPVVVCDSKAQANQYVKFLLNFLIEIFDKMPKWNIEYVNWQKRDNEYYDNLSHIEKEKKKYIDKIIWPLNHNMSDIFNASNNSPYFNDKTFKITKIKYVMKD